MLPTQRVAVAFTFAAASLACSSKTTITPPPSVATSHPPVLLADDGLSAEAALNSAMERSNPVRPGLSFGAPDAGTAGLPPEDPACLNHTGDPGTCWGEWLKEEGEIDYTPVARGALGAGPWPTTASVTMGKAEGLQLPILYVGTDTAQNIYAVSEGALFIRRAGKTSFEVYPQNTSGLKDYPFQSVAGQAPGIAYVGHVGLTPDSEFNTPPTDPPALTHSGGLDRVQLTPTGISVTQIWTHNSNSPSGAYSHDRTLYNIFVPKRGPAAGEVYTSSEHCVTRRQGEYWASHRHIEVTYGGSQHYGSARAVTVTDDGALWYGSDFELGSLAYTPRMYEWYFDNSWILPTNVYGTEEEQDWYRGIGVASNGDVWAAANGNGLAHLYDVDVARNSGQVESLGTPDLNMNTLVVDLDDTVWIGADSGAYRYSPTTRQWTSYPAAGGGINHIYLDDTVTPRALYMATAGGIFVYRGP